MHLKYPKVFVVGLDNLDKTQTISRYSITEAPKFDKNTNTWPVQFIRLFLWFFIVIYRCQTLSYRPAETITTTAAKFNACLRGIDQTGCFKLSRVAYVHQSFVMLQIIFCCMHTFNFSFCNKVIISYCNISLQHATLNDLKMH